MSKKKKITTSTGVEVRHKPLGLRIWNNRGYYVMFCFLISHCMAGFMHSTITSP